MKYKTCFWAFLIIILVLFIFSRELGKEAPNNHVDDSMKNFCTSESRKANFCIEIYDPVCGWFNDEIKCLKYPCAMTYSNSCFACMDKKVLYWTEGECPE